MNLLNLPKGWAEVSLGELCNWGSGGTPRRSVPDYFNGGIPWVTISDLNDSTVFDTSETISLAGLENSSAKMVPEGAVLIALYGSIGKLGIASKPLTTNQAIAHSFPNPDGYDKNYLFYFLLGQRENLLSLGSGVTQKNIYLGDLKAFNIPIAPRAEQTRIVEKLEELFSDLDAGVAELKAAQKKLAQYRQSLLNAAVEGELTAKWRTKNKPKETGAQLLERILKERRARWEVKQLAKFKEKGKTPPKGWQEQYPEPVQPDTANLPELPEGWVWSSIGQCFSVAVGATPSRKEPAYWNGNIPWVSSGEVRFNRINETKEKISEDGLNNSSTQINPIGSVLLGMIGEGKTRGQVAILDIEAANNQNCAAIWVSETDLPPEYVYYWLWSRYEETRSDSSGNNQPALNKFIIERIPFPLPPLSESEHIVKTLESAFNCAFEQESSINHSLNQATAQRKNILRAAFSGKLVPQDPNDEPASVLLDRIREERKKQAAQPKQRKAKVTKEVSTVARKLIDVLNEAGDWITAQEAFRRCGIADGATTEEVEELYAELRRLDKDKRVIVEPVADADGIKQYDRLRLTAKG